MKKEDFQLVIDSITKRVEKCHIYLDNVKDTNSLLKMKLEDLLKLKEFCKNEVNDQTKILMVDTYHLLGMGNMSSAQMNKFTSKIAEYASFRSNMKSISSNLKEFDNLPKLPTKSKYRLLALCDLTLTQNINEGDNLEELDNDDVNTYNALIKEEKQKNTADVQNVVESSDTLFNTVMPVNYTFEYKNNIMHVRDHYIQVSLKDISAVNDNLKYFLGLTDCDSQLKDAILGRRERCGIKWKTFDNDCAYGIMNNTQLDQLKKKV